jgi:hypothetical protein
MAMGKRTLMAILLSEMKYIEVPEIVYRNKTRWKSFYQC